MDALVPYISTETLEYHYGKHHRAYVTQLNKLVTDTPFAQMPLEEIIKKSSGAIFNNAGQIWNHTFYWSCLSPQGGGEPPAKVRDALVKAFGSVEDFKDKFTQAAIGTFGSGWAWLVQDQQGALSIISTSNAGNPITQELTPLLTCDVWEHAYYIDYRNVRADYLGAFWNLVNWSFVQDGLK
jgi:Fe-Mn family superoxide dismutase